VGGDRFFLGLFVGIGLAFAPLLVTQLKINTGIAARERGAEAERWTAEELEKLDPKQWKVFHDVPVRWGNVDHVAVGPGRVYAIETKWTTAKGRFREGAAKQAAKQATPVRRGRTRNDPGLGLLIKVRLVVERSGRAYPPTGSVWTGRRHVRCGPWSRRPSRSLSRPRDRAVPGTSDAAAEPPVGSVPDPQEAQGIAGAGGAAAVVPHDGVDRWEGRVRHPDAVADAEDLGGPDAAVVSADDADAEVGLVSRHVVYGVEDGCAVPLGLHPSDVRLGRVRRSHEDVLTTASEVRVRTELRGGVPVAGCQHLL